MNFSFYRIHKYTLNHCEEVDFRGFDDDTNLSGCLKIGEN